MNPDAIYLRFLEIRTYVGWSEDDERRVRTMAPVLEPCFPGLIDDFYAEIDRHPDARRVITGGDEQIARLKGSLLRWLAELFYGEYDRDYVARRWRVGLRHAQIGLSQTYVNAAMSRLRAGLLVYAASHRPDADSEALANRISLNRLIDCDLAIIEDAYQTEFTARQQRIERLAAIGQVSGGVAHELRNPLNVIKTSIYYLRHAQQLSPDKLAAHLERIDRQATLADHVISALNDFARLSEPVFTAVDPDALIATVIESLMRPAEVQVIVERPPDGAFAHGDERQLAIVLSNLARNACDAMPQGGILTFGVREESGAVHISVADTGVGIAPDKLPHVMEPLYSTKSRGLGLGLAIAKAIVDKHRGHIQAESKLGQGSRFTVVLPAAAGRVG